MKILLTSIAFSLSLLSCAQRPQDLRIPVGDQRKPTQKEAVATFAQGCFWHTEIVFQSLKGVRDAVSGYAGGQTKNPGYEEVCSGKTGHAECVQVYYDPSQISFETLVDAYFASMDPTSLNRQGNDVGTHYRSIAFYRNEKEKQIIEDAIKKINASKKYKKPVVTEVQPIERFYPAEAYHQEYIFHHPDNGYVQNISIPEYLHFRKTFRGPFKP